MSFSLQRRRRGTTGNRSWREVDSSETSRTELDARAAANNEADHVFEWAVFEQLAPPTEG